MPHMRKSVKQIGINYVKKSLNFTVASTGRVGVLIKGFRRSDRLNRAVTDFMRELSIMARLERDRQRYQAGRLAQR